MSLISDINRDYQDNLKFYQSLQKEIEDNVEGRIPHHKTVVLNILVKRLDIKTYLDVGTHNGGSMSYVVNQHKGPVDCYGIDLFEDIKNNRDNISFDKASKNIHKNNKSKSSVTLIKGDCLEENTFNQFKDIKFDLIFLDALMGEGVRSNVVDYGKFLKKGGILVFDDYESRYKSIVKAADELNREYFEEIGLFQNCCLIFKKKKSFVNGLDVFKTLSPPKEEAKKEEQKTPVNKFDENSPISFGGKPPMVFKHEGFTLIGEEEESKKLSNSKINKDLKFIKKNLPEGGSKVLQVGGSVLLPTLMEKGCDYKVVESNFHKARALAFNKKTNKNNFKIIIKPSTPTNLEKILEEGFDCLILDLKRKDWGTYVICQDNKNLIIRKPNKNKKDLKIILESLGFKKKDSSGGYYLYVNES